ncbi:MAG: hypothetical protein MH137_00315 [Flavobacteriales bacterium]|nr:hypothetical protein [Flavobacteriales bacterium]
MNILLRINFCGVLTVLCSEIRHCAKRQNVIGKLADRPRNKKQLNGFKINIPKIILDKDVLNGNEFGCRQQDFADIIETARQNSLAISGGQVQYALPDGTCELYWLSYDTADKKADETWKTYCDRTAKECLEKFNSLIQAIDIEKEALNSFKFLQDKKHSGVDINKYRTFILYFDSET